MNRAEQIEQCFKNKHRSTTEGYLKKLHHRGWRRFCKSLSELKPMYNRYSGWAG